MSGNVTIIGCPKLDEGSYTDKLAAIIAANDITSVTVARMRCPAAAASSARRRRGLRPVGQGHPPSKWSPSPSTATSSAEHGRPSSTITASETIPATSGSSLLPGREAHHEGGMAPTPPSMHPDRTSSHYPSGHPRLREPRTRQPTVSFELRPGAPASQPVNR
ncbi:MAG: hypothetical protein ACLTDR_16855 [Adlercreutzia equolifaciens]